MGSEKNSLESADILETVPSSFWDELTKVINSIDIAFDDEVSKKQVLKAETMDVKVKEEDSDVEIIEKSNDIIEISDSDESSGKNSTLENTCVSREKNVMEEVELKPQIDRPLSVSERLEIKTDLREYILKKMSQAKDIIPKNIGFRRRETITATAHEKSSRGLRKSVHFNLPPIEEETSPSSSTDLILPRLTRARRTLSLQCQKTASGFENHRESPDTTSHHLNTPIIENEAQTFEASSRDINPNNNNNNRPFVFDRFHTPPPECHPLSSYKPKGILKRRITIHDADNMHQEIINSEENTYSLDNRAKRVNSSYRNETGEPKPILKRRMTISESDTYRERPQHEHYVIASHNPDKRIRMSSNRDVTPPAPTISSIRNNEIYDNSTSKPKMISSRRNTMYDRRPIAGNYQHERSPSNFSASKPKRISIRRNTFNDHRTSITHHYNERRPICPPAPKVKPNSISSRRTTVVERRPSTSHHYNERRPNNSHHYNDRRPSTSHHYNPHHKRNYENTHNSYRDQHPNHKHYQENVKYSPSRVCNRRSTIHNAKESSPPHYSSFNKRDNFYTAKKNYQRSSRDSSDSNDDDENHGRAFVGNKKLKDEIIRKAHISKDGKHLTIGQTIKEIKRKYYWHNDLNSIVSYIKKCQQCCQYLNRIQGKK